MNSLNELLLRRKNMVFLPAKGGKTSAASVATFNLELQGLGYTLSASILASLQATTASRFHDFCDEVLNILKELKGVKNYRPMYPNFPTQVMKASDAELYLNAVLHYFTAWVSDLTSGETDIWLPKYRKDHRSPLNEKVKLTVILPANNHVLDTILEDLMMSNTSLSETDKRDIATLAEAGKTAVRDDIPQKENRALIGALYAKHMDREDILTFLRANFKTATDVLRLATAMSGGDVSLAENTKFRGFRRAERRVLLSLLDACGNLEEDMLRNAQRFIRLGERLHPGEYKFNSAATAFRKIRNGEHIDTFYSRLEACIRSGSVLGAVVLLRDRPGEFARRLDQLLSASRVATKSVLDAFARVVDDVSTPVLLQVATHFKSRNTQNLRVVFPKGNVARAHAIPGRRVTLDAEHTQRVVSICETALESRFQALPSLGKVYVDPVLKDYLVPFSQRSASKSLRTLTRGSRVGFPNTKDTLRFFIWWKNQDNQDNEVADKDSWERGSNRVDLDLSAVMYDPEWVQMERIAYYNLRNSDYRAYHSGDITDAPRGACEFIDIDIPSILKYGGRYVVMMVNSFTGQSFDTVPEASAGWMLRAMPKSGEVFEPKTVMDRLDITSESKQVMPLVIDCVERKVIWADVAVSVNKGYANNVDANSDTIATIGRAFTKIVKPTLYDLFTLHGHARGTLVTAEKADTVFGVKEALDLAGIAAKFLANAEKKKAAKS